MRKILIFICAAVLLVLTACSNPIESGIDAPEKEDKTRTQLYVANFNGGFGKDWIESLKARFEEDYKDISFEPEKKGVQVRISNSKTNAQTWLTDMDGSQNEIFFTEWMYLSDHLSQNKLLDITDIVTENLNESSTITSITGSKEKLGAPNEGTIEDKLEPEQIEYFKQSGGYYALPHYQAYTGIVYDIDLFEDYRFYFAANKNNDNDGFIIRNTDQRSFGPDGKTGIDPESDIDYSADDGLPSTFEEFFKLCSYMKEQGVTPLAWTGGNQVYISEFVNLLMANYTGRDQFMLNYNMLGTATSLLQDDGITPYGDVDITMENAYLLARQKGKLDAFKFIEGIIKGEHYSVSHSFSSAVSHLSMQDSFLWSRFSSQPDIAMIIEGNWWENEAKATWDSMANTPGARKNQRKLGFLPLPWPTIAQIGQTPTYLDSLYSACFIKASIDENKIPLAKLFLQYANTNQSLADFTAKTGQARSLKYALTNEQYENLTYFQKSCWNVHQNSQWVYPYSANKLYNYTPSNFSTSYFNRSTYMGISQTMPHVSMRNNSSLNSLLYWQGSVNLNSRSNWESSYKSVWEV